MSVAGEKLVVGTAGRKVGAGCFYSFSCFYSPGLGLGPEKHGFCPAEKRVQPEVPDQVCCNSDADKFQFVLRLLKLFCSGVSAASQTSQDTFSVLLRFELAYNVCIGLSCCTGPCCC